VSHPVKLARQKRAAREVAKIMFASLQQVSEEERKVRIKAIQKAKVKVSRKRIEKTPKRVSTQENLLSPSRVAVAR
jgi:hypothetical protein